MWYRIFMLQYLLNCHFTFDCSVCLDVICFDLPSHLCQFSGLVWYGFYAHIHRTRTKTANDLVV
jgi:hypothetical protein